MPTIDDEFTSEGKLCSFNQVVISSTIPNPTTKQQFRCKHTICQNQSYQVMKCTSPSQNNQHFNNDFSSTRWYFFYFLWSISHLYYRMQREFSIYFEKSSFHVLSTLQYFVFKYICIVMLARYLLCICFEIIRKCVWSTWKVDTLQNYMCIQNKSTPINEWLLWYVFGPIKTFIYLHLV